MQVLPEILRASIQPKATFHKTGRRGLDCCIALDILAEISKVAHYQPLGNESSLAAPPPENLVKPPFWRVSP